jgi:hypothetical protein
VNHIIAKLRKYFEKDVFKEYTVTSSTGDSGLMSDEK